MGVFGNWSEPAPAKTPRTMLRVPQPEWVDVCILVEGCYPYITGGVSSWLNWLITELPEYTFAVVAITPNETPGEFKYQLSSNIKSFQAVSLHKSTNNVMWSSATSHVEPDHLADCLCRLGEEGRLHNLVDLMKVIREGGLSYDVLMNSRFSWNVVHNMYERQMPNGSFLHYFWAWRALYGGLFSMLLTPLPQARVYHTISTGYAGLLAARASVERRRPALITEHGIYTNERRIEILMADWISVSLEKGYSITDKRFDLKDMWVRNFESYGKICYDACTKVVTLYEDNQFLQKKLGAQEQRLQVIPNGVNWDKFSKLPRAGITDQPTVGLIGRVVPIKDIKTFLFAVAKVRKELPQLKALVIGPTDEDEAYYRECVELADDLDLVGCLEFTGSQDITKLLPLIHVLVLTSISEAQPLVVLESGAAGIPSVTTDVGSCRELIEGRKNETPKKGPGGIVANVASSDQIAEGLERLLSSPDTRRQYGEAMARRVHDSYNITDVRVMYANLYGDLCGRNEPARLGGLH
ncbi:MAG: GT4 family glycosyltransferase PelF [Methyloligellaceae bacterium]